MKVNFRVSNSFMEQTAKFNPSLSRHTMFFRFFRQSMNCITSTPSIIQNKHGDCHRGCPETFLAAGGLCDIGRSDDQPAGFIDLLFFRPGFVGVHFQSEGGAEHVRGQVFGHVGRLPLIHAVSVHFADVAPVFSCFRDGDADGRGDEPAVFAGIRPRHHAIGDTAGSDMLEALGPAYHRAVRRQDGGNLHQVLLSDAGLTQGFFKRL